MWNFILNNIVFIFWSLFGISSLLFIMRKFQQILLLLLDHDQEISTYSKSIYNLKNEIIEYNLYCHRLQGEIIDLKNRIKHLEDHKEKRFIHRREEGE